MEKYPSGSKERGRGLTPELKRAIGRVTVAAAIFVMGASAGIGGTVAYENWLHASHPPLGGEVVCRSGPVVGVWVESQDGDGGWATLEVEPHDPHKARFIKHLPGPGAAATVDVGCGGTPQHWEHNDRALNVPIGSSPVKLMCTDYPNVKFGSCALEP